MPNRDRRGALLAVGCARAGGEALRAARSDAREAALPPLSYTGDTHGLSPLVWRRGWTRCQSSLGGQSRPIRRSDPPCEPQRSPLKAGRQEDVSRPPIGMEII